MKKPALPKQKVSFVIAEQLAKQFKDEVLPIFEKYKRYEYNIRTHEKGNSNNTGSHDRMQER